MTQLCQCPDCEGKGAIADSPCDDCGGEGEVDGKTCANCNGAGVCVCCRCEGTGSITPEDYSTGWKG